MIAIKAHGGDLGKALGQIVKNENNFFLNKKLICSRPGRAPLETRVKHICKPCIYFSMKEITMLVSAKPFVWSTWDVDLGFKL